MTTNAISSYMTEQSALPFCPGCGHDRLLKELDRALQRLDLTWLQETYRVGHRWAAQGERQRMWRVLKVERKRLGLDKKLELLTQEGLRVLEDLKRHIEQCRRLLPREDRKALEGEIVRARKCGKQASKHYLQARQLEKRLLHLYEVQEKRLVS